MGKKRRNNEKPNKKQHEKKRRGNRNYNDMQWKAEKFKLKIQLNRYGLDIKEINGDGNCMFRAISDQISGAEDMHLELRNLSVDYMRDNSDDFQPFIEDDEEFNSYMQKMTNPGTWGGNLELQALSMALQVNINIHRLNEPVWEIINFNDKRSIHLSYHDGDHYNSVRLKGDINSEYPRPISESLTIVETKEEHINNGFQECAEYIREAYGLEDIQKSIRVLKRMYGEPPDIELVMEGIGKIMDEVYAEEDEVKQDSEWENGRKKEKEKEKGRERDRDRDKEEKKEKKEWEHGRKKGKEEKTESKCIVSGKKPILLPSNKQKCWCGSGKVYKNCCKATDHLRETEEEKIISDMKSLQI